MVYMASKESESPEPPAPARAGGRERPTVARESLSQLYPQHTEDLLTSRVSIPGPLKKGRGLRSTTLSFVINKVYSTQPPPEKKMPLRSQCHFPLVVSASTWKWSISPRKTAFEMISSFLKMYH